jgi:hypothetical protein
MAKRVRNPGLIQWRSGILNVSPLVRVETKVPINFIQPMHRVGHDLDL